MKALNPIFAFLIVLGFVAQTHADHHLKPMKLDGVWKVVASMDGGNERELTWTIKKDGDKLSGTSFDHEDDSERDFDRVQVKEKNVVMEMDLEADGQDVTIRIEGEEKSAGKLVGKWSVVGTGYEGEFVAMREVEFAGEWDAVSVLPDGNELESVLKITKKNGKLTGVLDGQAGQLDLDKVAVKDNQLHVEFTFEMQGNEIDVTIKAKPEGDNKLVGEWSVPNGGGTTGDWHAVRKPKGLAGEWVVVAKVPDADDYKGVMTLAIKDGKYSGNTKGPDGEVGEMKKVAFDGSKFIYAVPFERDGYEGLINVEAKMEKDGSLKGEWILTDDDGQEWARDEWQASRK